MQCNKADCSPASATGYAEITTSSIIIQLVLEPRLLSSYEISLLWCTCIITLLLINVAYCSSLFQIAVINCWLLLFVTMNVAVADCWSLFYITVANYWYSLLWAQCVMKWMRQRCRRCCCCREKRKKVFKGKILVLQLFVIVAQTLSNIYLSMLKK